MQYIHIYLHNTTYYLVFRTFDLELENKIMTTQYSSYGAGLLRIGLGSMWISHGLLKFLVFGIAGTAGFFESVGMPGWIAGPVAFTEVVGGLMIVAGIYGRVVSVALLPILFGAGMVHLANGWVFSNANGGWEYPAFLILASVVHILLGDGAWALSGRVWKENAGYANLLR